MLKRSTVLHECEDIEEEIAYEDNHLRIVSDPTMDEDSYMFKVYKYDDNLNLIDVSRIRISMLEPEYISCDCQNYILNNDDIDTIIEALVSKREPNLLKYGHNEYPYTVWDVLVYESNYLYELN